jgi:hypothetical protein
MFSIEEFMWASILRVFFFFFPVICSTGTNTVGESKLVVHTTFHNGEADLRIFNLSC